MEANISNLPSPGTTGMTHPIAVIECCTCKSRGFSYLEYAEAEALLCDGSVSRHCQVCGKETMWHQLDFPSRKKNLKSA